MIPKQLWEDIEKEGWYSGEVPGYPVISFDILEEILERYFKEEPNY